MLLVGTVAPLADSGEQPTPGFGGENGPGSPVVHGVSGISGVASILSPWLNNERTTDVGVTCQDGIGRIWVDDGSGIQWVGTCEVTEADQLARSLIRKGGRHLDDAHPVADVVIDTLRVHCVLPPISVGGAAISIRVGRHQTLDLLALEQAGMFSQAAGHSLRRMIQDGQRILIAGATGSGKTTLLAALLGAIEQQQRIVTIEDVAELRPAHPHVVQLCTRQANVEGAGEVALAALTRSALRMRPDWLVMGECRGDEIGQFLMALNTGHRGAGTIHAHSLHDVPARLIGLGLLAGWTAETTAHIVPSAFDRVVFLSRTVTGRTVQAVGRFEVHAGELTVVEESL